MPDEQVDDRPEPMEADREEKTAVRAYSIS